MILFPDQIMCWCISFHLPGSSKNTLIWSIYLSSIHLHMYIFIPQIKSKLKIELQSLSHIFLNLFRLPYQCNECRYLSSLSRWPHAIIICYQNLTESKQVLWERSSVNNGLLNIQLWHLSLLFWLDHVTLISSDILIHLLLVQLSHYYNLLIDWRCVFMASSGLTKQLNISCFLKAFMSFILACT